MQTVEDVRAAWDTYLVRRSLLLSGFVRIAVEQDAEDVGLARRELDLAASVSWRSETLQDALASLLLIDLASIVNEALAVALDGLESRTKIKRASHQERLQLASDHGRLLDFPAQEKLKSDRNAAGHERVTFNSRELRVHEATVRRQLSSWGHVDPSTDFSPTVAPGRWEQDATRWRRRVWVGVQESAGDRAWGYTITQSAQCSPGVTCPEEATVVSVGDSAPEWCKLRVDQDAATESQRELAIPLSSGPRPPPSGQTTDT